jgi:hypothetical protein
VHGGYQATAGASAAGFGDFAPQTSGTRGPHGRRTDRQEATFLFKKIFHLTFP